MVYMEGKAFPTNSPLRGAVSMTFDDRYIPDSLRSLDSQGVGAAYDAYFPEIDR
jgi:hypothetical protein